jgi:hypothetical protein
MTSLWQLACQAENGALNTAASGFEAVFSRFMQIPALTAVDVGCLVFEQSRRTCPKLQHASKTVIKNPIRLDKPEGKPARFANV